MSKQKRFIKIDGKTKSEKASVFINKSLNINGIINTFILSFLNNNIIIISMKKIKKA